MRDEAEINVQYDVRNHKSQVISDGILKLAVGSGGVLYDSDVLHEFILELDGCII